MAEQISSKKNKNKKKAPVSEEREMTFWDHLTELRGTFVRSLVAIVILAIIAFANKGFIFNEIILAPKEPVFLTNRILCTLGQLLGIDYFCVKDLALEIININMSGQFMTHMYISFVVGFIVAAPYIIYEFWRFVKPALYDVERKSSGGAVLVFSFLFYLGVLFSYFLIVPLTLNFFGSYHVSEMVRNQISLSSYISTVVSVTLSIGLIFELPIVIYFLAKVGIVDIDFLKRNRKYTLVIVLILSAIVTPPDVFSQVLVTAPLMLLYEFSIFLAKRAVKKNAIEN
ncbi:MAG: twin-arginine translocase subunit TatC [Bacteroidales bacterium]|jgi:sec-independent protein translocase protein TatC|nr:twin-arginine translocase subunit TatC [Bacteroidales bacterium]